MRSIDPRANEYPWQSPFVYHANSPIWQVDILGGGGGDPPPITGNEKVGDNVSYDGDSWGWDGEQWLHSIPTVMAVSTGVERVQKNKSGKVGKWYGSLLPSEAEAAISHSDNYINEVGYMYSGIYAALSVPAAATYTGGIATAMGRESVINGGSELVAQWVASGFDISKIDWADVAVASTGLGTVGKSILGAGLDVSLDGGTVSAFGILGENKNLTSVGIDMMLGYAGEKSSKLMTGKTVGHLMSTLSPDKYKKVFTGQYKQVWTGGKNMGDGGYGGNWYRPKYRLDKVYTWKKALIYSGKGMYSKIPIAFTIDLYSKAFGNILKYQAEK